MIGAILENGEVKKEYYNQGYIYKNIENFKNKKGICYISEYQTNNITNGKEGEDFETYKSLKNKVRQAFKDFEIDTTIYNEDELVKQLFEMLDWQFADTLLNEIMENIEED